MGVKHIHLLDAPVSTKNYFQSIGRGIRLCSHRGMVEQSTVVYEYFSDLPERLVDTYDKCMETKAVIRDFIDKVRARLATITPTLATQPPLCSTPPPYVEYSNGSRVSIHELDTSTFAVEGIAGTAGGFAGDLLWLNGTPVREQRIQVRRSTTVEKGHGFKLWEQIGYRLKKIQCAILTHASSTCWRRCCNSAAKIWRVNCSMSSTSRSS